MIGFQYYGGKNRSAPWICSLLPPIQTYVEPFCGSLAVLMNRKRSRREIANDLDGNVVNFFRVLRTREDDLMRALELTPYAKEEFNAAKDLMKTPVDDELERARLFFVIQQQAMFARQDASWKFSYASECRAAGRTWDNRIDDLRNIAKRLHAVEFFCGDGCSVIKSFDSPKCLLYCDPPYDESTRSSKTGYRQDTSDEFQDRFLSAIKASKALIAVSHYPCKLYDNALSGWKRHDMSMNVHSRSNNKAKKEVLVESLYTNYSAEVGLFEGGMK